MSTTSSILSITKTLDSQQLNANVTDPSVLLLMPSSTTTQQQQLADSPRQAHIVEFYALPLIFLVGTVCNILTFCVMRRKKMRHQSTYFYMAVLAVTDELVLIFGCLNFWIYLNSGTNLALLSNMSCKLVCLLFYATLHFSVWMVVVMTVERFIAVAFPLQAMHLCTVKRAKMATCLLLVVILAINAHFLFTHTLNAVNDQRSCTTTSHSAEIFMTKIWPWIDASLYSFVPLFLLILFNILIIWSLVHASRNIDKLTNRNTKSLSTTSLHNNLNMIQNAAVNYPNNKNSNHYQQKLQYRSNHTPQQVQQQPPPVSSTNRRLTIMLLVVSTTFLITSTPIVTLQTVELVGGLTNSFLLSIIKGVFLSLQYLNHSINFFLYAVTGKTFRREFLAMFKPFMLSKKGANASGTTFTNANTMASSGFASKKVTKIAYKPVRQIREFQKPVVRKKFESNV